MPTNRRAFLNRLPLLAASAKCLSFSQPVSARNPDLEKSEPLILIPQEGLSGWEQTDFYKPGKVQIASGVLSLGRGNPMTGVTTSRKDLPATDFEISFEARRLDGDDFFAALTFPVGTGFLTFVNGGWSGNITGLSSIDGADASENETSCLIKFENEVWYQMKVRVQAEQVQCFVNDKKVVDFDGTGRSLKTRVESRPSQPLGFACFDCSSEIRNAILRQI